MAGKKILVVDDDAELISILRIMLKGAGYQVESTQGVETFEKIMAFRPDLILMDISMPGLSGLEISTLLKMTPATKSVPLIIISAQVKYEEESRKVGADAFLAKPFQMKELRSLIERFVAAS